MPQFPHLKFAGNLVGKARFYGGGSESAKTKHNKIERKKHSESLFENTSKLNQDWDNHIAEREALNLAPLNEDIEPIFLQINPSLLSQAEFNLESFGIEIISEEDDGFIVGASLDKLRSLEEKIKGFAEKEGGTGKIADLWKIIDGNRSEWKPQHVLSPALLEKWKTIEDTQVYKVEVAIAFDKPIGKEPDRSKRGGERRLEKYRQQQIEREELLMQRQTNFEEFVNFYKGEFKSGFIDLEDSFGCQISINGKGLKDLVVNYPYVFEVNEVDEIGGTDDIESDTTDFQFEVIPPEENSTEVGIIDSGIMENHKFLEKAIKPENSKSYVIHDTSTADLVSHGGHGTKVAGAVLYPQGLSVIKDTYQLPCFVRNIRILNKDNKLEESQYPAELMQKIVEENLDCRIFNLSINSNAPFRKKHMSSWAAMLDKLIHENDILFIVSTGNVSFQDIRRYIQTGKTYPDYLSFPYCKIANPAQSSYSLVVGSVNDISFEDDYWQSLGNKDDIAAYSKTGTGIWGHIKPDVVEYGGGMKASKSKLPNVKEIGIELVRSTLDGGRAVNKESVGTSYATPKVTHIAAILQNLYGDENINLIRALIVQGARLPGNHFLNPTKEAIEHFGYGIPSLERVTKNTERRVTFYNTNKIIAEEGQIYTLKIPEELRNPGEEYDILIEVTLAYTAKNRRTRQRTKSYLSTWLDWESSKLEETQEDFKNRMLRELDGKELENNSDSDGVIQWKIRERSDWGEVKDINRNNSSVQKDWVILKSYQLPEEIGFAVKGHKGWDLNKNPTPYALTVSIEVLGEDIPIYESIRIENEIEIEV